jgi:hypothetical protein
MEKLGLGGSEPVGDASPQRDEAGDAYGERQGLGQVGELGLGVRTERRGERVEQRDVRPDDRPTRREQLRSLSVEAFLGGPVELQRDDQRPLVLGSALHLHLVPARALTDAPAPGTPMPPSPIG